MTLQARELRPAAFADTAGDETQPAIVILLYTAPVPAGAPRALEGGEIGWFTLREVAALAMPPLDIQLARQLFAQA